MTDFDQLAASRRRWIDEVLIPWCRSASLSQLKRAEREWTDIAGRVDPQSTLWMWAWSRFPGLVAEDLQRLDETYAVVVTLQDGSQCTGYPDARQSQQGELVLVGANGELGPFSLDNVKELKRVAPSQGD